MAQPTAAGRRPLAANRILRVLLTMVTLASCSTSGSPVPSNTSPPPASVSCQSAVDPEVPAYALDSCDEAVAAVRSMTEDQVHPVSRIYLTPGVFDCDNFWPGVGSSGNCPEASLLPGVAMYGWISFTGDDRIMAVALYRDQPTDRGQAVAAPWKPVILEFAVPPAGWRMP
ncbi:MAG: hypothetical protein V4515_05820 [Chloroflexota bacterium]